MLLVNESEHFQSVQPPEEICSTVFRRRVTL